MVDEQQPTFTVPPEPKQQAYGGFTQFHNCNLLIATCELPRANNSYFQTNEEVLSSEFFCNTKINSIIFCNLSLRVNTV